MGTTRRLLAPVSLLCLLALHSTPVSAQPQIERVTRLAAASTGHIEGSVVDEAGKPAARGDRTVIVKVDGMDIALEPQTNGFITKEPLQAKEPAQIVVQIRAKADAKPANFRVTLNTSLCGECKRPEYGCTCDH